MCLVVFLFVYMPIYIWYIFISVLVVVKLVLKLNLKNNNNNIPFNFYTCFILIADIYYFNLIFFLQLANYNSIGLLQEMKLSSCFAGFPSSASTDVGEDLIGAESRIIIASLFLVFSGFRMNASSWPMFLLRTLNGAEIAPATAFKKVLYLLGEIINLHGCNHASHIKRFWWHWRSVIPSGAAAAAPERLQARDETGGRGQEEPVPDLSGHHRRGEGGRGVRDVRRLEGGVRLLVPLWLQGHLPRGLVHRHQTQPAAARKQQWVTAAQITECCHTCSPFTDNSLLDQKRSPMGSFHQISAFYIPKK